MQPDRSRKIAQVAAAILVPVSAFLGFRFVREQHRQKAAPPVLFVLPDNLNLPGNPNRVADVADHDRACMIGHWPHKGRFCRPIDGPGKFRRGVTLARLSQQGVNHDAG